MFILLLVASQAIDPVESTIRLQYYTLVVLIQINYFCNSEEAAEEEAPTRFPGVETPPKPIHI